MRAIRFEDDPVENLGTGVASQYLAPFEEVDVESSVQQQARSRTSRPAGADHRDARATHPLPPKLSCAIAGNDTIASSIASQALATTVLGFEMHQAAFSRRLSRLLHFASPWQQANRCAPHSRRPTQGRASHHGRHGPYNAAHARSPDPDRGEPARERVLMGNPVPRRTRSPTRASARATTLPQTIKVPIRLRPAGGMPALGCARIEVQLVPRSMAFFILLTMFGILGNSL
jgi:hypothetical protein